MNFLEFFLNFLYPNNSPSPPKHFLIDLSGIYDNIGPGRFYHINFILVFSSVFFVPILGYVYKKGTRRVRATHMIW